MATEALYRADAGQRACDARVEGRIGEGAVVLDRTVFYPGGGGQPCDTGWLETGAGGRHPVRAAGPGEDGTILHHLADPAVPLARGDTVRAVLDWPRRHRIMRMHTALHLLSVVLPWPVTGGAVGSDKSRLDFDLPESPDRERLAAELAGLVAADLPVGEVWISQAELDRRPELVKTVGARPPAGAGQVRLVRIGEPAAPVDLQPCGGTHVRSTGEIGALRIGRIEKKGRNNRRVNLLLPE